MSGSTRLAALALASALAAPAASLAEEDADPLDALKAVARAKFDALQRTPPDRTREMAKTAHEGIEARFEQFAAGKITPDRVLEWSVQLLQAHLALLDANADPAPLYEWYWRQMGEMEAIAEVNSQVGKIASSDLADARRLSLQAELDWLAHQNREGKAPPRPNPFPPAEDYLLGKSRNPARDQWEALQAAPRDLAQARLEAARETLDARLKNGQAGKILASYLQSSARTVLDAELALLDKDADSTALLERHWERTRWIEAIADVGVNNGKLPLYDLYTCRCCRLEAEIAWIRAWKKAEKAGVRKGATPRLPPEGDMVEDAGRARAAFEASRADERQLLGDRRQAARDAYREIYQMFQAGKVILLPLESSLRLLEADRAFAAGPDEEAAAAERHWRRLLDLEAITEKALRAGKISTPDVMAVRYARLEAEGWMVEATAKREGK